MSTPIDKLAQKAIDGLSDMLNRLDKQRELTEGYSAALCKEYQGLARSLSTLVREVRGMERDKISQAQKMTVAEQRRAIVDFFREQSPAQQAQILKDMEKSVK